MKKIGIITIHSPHNYGAMLQAYALQKKLYNLGFDNEIINYNTSITEAQKKLFYPLTSVKSIIDNLRTLSNYKNRKIRFDRFESFLREEIVLSYDLCSNGEAVNNTLPYDLYITGSDQTFNLRLGGKVEDRYPFFLPNITEKKKISYAASFGEHLNELTKEDKIFIKKYLNKYDRLGIREQDGIDFLKQLGLESQLTLDPTLLLTRDEWESLTTLQNNFKRDYILYYSVLADKHTVQYVNLLSKKLQLPVLAPHLKNQFELFSNNFIRVEESGPKEFLSLVKHAKLICTTSFHGTIFSILFNKPFLSLKMKKGSRLKTLLSTLHLESRFVDPHIPQSSISIENVFSLDFQEANSFLDEERKKSILFLRNEIDDCFNKIKGE